MSRDRSLDILVARWPLVRPFLAVGAASIVAGGITAALTRPTGSTLGSWMAAYLVLVAGVAEIALGAGQAWLTPRRAWPCRARPRVGGLERCLRRDHHRHACGCTALDHARLLTTLAGVALVVALARFLVGVRSARATSNAPIVLYQFVVTIVLVSTPVGSRWRGSATV